MLVLFETAAGYAIFKLLDDNKLKKSDNLYEDFSSPAAASKIVKLKHFEKFADITEALAATTAAVEGRVSKTLKRALKKHVAEVKDQLLVADAKLGSAIKEKLSLQCVSNSHVQELMRCIRSQADSLLSGLSGKEMSAMALGLAHSLSRYKLKFNPDKVDTMIVQSVSLLDDLDKELNNYMMRCREWYGWHFPELGKLVPDNMAFIRTVQLIGSREHASATDLSDILPTEMESAVKEAAEMSMGTEISEDDIENILAWCQQVVVLSEYRTHLHEYLRSRMMAIAPNLSVLVGELVGARLIAHAGSLMNLAKHPASTVQILGAEKALFRALKTKRDTPKYGLIYHSSLIGQASVKNKGRLSRMLAAKAALATRVDALGDESVPELGAGHRVKLEARLREMEEGSTRRISGSGKVAAKFEKYIGKSEVKHYPISLDSTVQAKKRKHSEEGEDSGVKKIKVEHSNVSVDPEELTLATPEKKKKKKIKTEWTEGEADQSVDVSVSSGKKKKKIKTEWTEGDADESVNVSVSSVKKKKIKSEWTEGEADGSVNVSVSSEKKKKKKKKDSFIEESLDDTATSLPGPSSPKKKKSKKGLDESAALDESSVLDVSEGGTKKKKKKKVKQEAE